jgi:DNA-binding beta-propeller fold protein YncE
MTHPDDCLLVCSPTSRTIEFFDVTTGRTRKVIRDVTAQPHEAGWDPARRRAYVTHPYRAGAYESSPKGHEISIVDVDNFEVVAVIDIAPYFAPHDIAVDQSSGLLYVGVEQHEGTNGIVVVDPETGKVRDNIPLEAPNAHWIALAQDGSKLYAAHKEWPQLSVVETSSGAVAAIDLPGGAEEIDISADGRWLYVVTPRAKAEVDSSVSDGEPVSQVLKIDTALAQVSGSLGFDHYNLGLHVAQDNTVLVTSKKTAASAASSSSTRPVPPDGLVHILDGDAMSLTATLPVGPFPLTIRTSPDSGTAWVASLGRGSVAVLDLRNLARTGELTCTRDEESDPAGSSHGLCYVAARGSAAV